MVLEQYLHLHRCLPRPCFHLPEYVDFVTATRGINHLRGTDVLEFALLRRGAAEFAALAEKDVLNEQESRRLAEIIDSVRRLVSLRSGLPKQGERGTSDEAEVLELGRRFAAVFDKCASFSVSWDWGVACLAGLVGEGLSPSFLLHLRTNYPRLFFGDGIEMLEAAAMANSLEVFKNVMQEFHENCWTAKKLCPAFPTIAQYATVPFFKGILDHSPISAFLEAGFLHHLAKHHRAELFGVLLRRLASPSPVRPRELVEQTLGSCLSIGNVEMIAELAISCPETFLEIDIAKYLVATIEKGDQPMFKVLLWDAEGHIRHFVSLDSALLANVLCKTMAHEQVEMMTELLHNYGPHLEIDPSVFFFAAARGLLWAMDLLVGEQPDGKYWIPNLRIDSIERKVLEAIAMGDHVEVLKFFVNRQACGDSRFEGLRLGARQNRLIMTACQYGKLSLVRFLLQRDPKTNQPLFPDVDPAAEGNFPLILACSQNRVDIVRELLQENEDGSRVFPTVNPAVDTNGALQMAVMNGCLEIVEILLQLVQDDQGVVTYKYPGTDVSAFYGLFFRQAIENGPNHVLEFLLRRNSDGSFVLPGLRLSTHLRRSLQEFITDP